MGCWKEIISIQCVYIHIYVWKCPYVTQCGIAWICIVQMQKCKNKGTIGSCSVKILKSICESLNSVTYFEGKQINMRQKTTTQNTIEFICIHQMVLGQQDLYSRLCGAGSPGTFSFLNNCSYFHHFFKFNLEHCMSIAFKRQIWKLKLGHLIVVCNTKLKYIRNSVQKYFRGNNTRCPIRLQQ